MKWWGMVIVVLLLVVVVIRDKPNDLDADDQVLGTQTLLPSPTPDWLKIISDNPTYRDGYVELAMASLQLGKIDEARSWLYRALEVDPNFVIPAQLVFLKNLLLQ